MAKKTQEQRLEEILAKTDFTVDDFEELATLKSIRDLEFRPDSRFPKGAFRRLAELPRLQFMEIKGCRIAPAQMADLAELPKLKRLDLTDCPITNGAVKHLIEHPTLIDLWIGGTKITDGACRDLATIPNLKWLILDRTKISDKGLAHLTTAPKLQNLWLNETAVTDAGILQLAVLPKLKLVGPQTKGTSVTEEGLEALFVAQRRARKSDLKPTPAAAGKRKRSSDPTSDPDALVDPAAEAAKRVLLEFFEAMNLWEQESARLSNQADEQDVSEKAWNKVVADCLKKVKKIFEHYCTAKKRAYGRTENFWTSEPPEYDPAIEKIVHIDLPTKRRIVIETKQNCRLKERYQYVLLKKADHWLVDGKKTWGGGGWTSTLL